MATPEIIDLIDVSPKQLVSVAAALDPVPGKRRRQPRSDGIEHAAPGRAAARAEAPFVGTGMEAIVARDSGAAIGPPWRCRRSGRRRAYRCARQTRI